MDIDNVDYVIVGEILSMVQDTSFDTRLVSCVLSRLMDFGYTVTENDVFLVAFSIRAVDSEIRNKCNIKELPEGLHVSAINRVFGTILLELKSTNRLGSVVDLDSAVESVKIGDTDISFGDSSKSPEQRLDTLISSLKSCGEGELVCYRKLRWF